MFKTNGTGKYEIKQLYGGTGKNGGYTFITIEDELKEGQKFAEKLKINIWGEDLSGKFKVGQTISILGVNGLGIVAQKDKVKKDANGKDIWYRNLTIECSADDIVVATGTEKKKEEPTELQPIDNTEELPF